MTEIIAIHAREVLDSRGNPTVEAEVLLSGGAMGRAMVPSGASTGEHEAIELRDGDKSRYLGKGVTRAVDNIRQIITPEILGMDASEQAAIDQEMLRIDGTSNKAKLGANAILAVSLAIARAAADAHGLPLYRYLGGVGALTLPVPLMNIINGGAHADNNLDIQEFMVVPAGLPTFAEALRAGAEVFHNLKKLLKDRGKVTAVGDEGGFAPSLDSADDALSVIGEAVEKAGYKLGEDIFLALDVAATEFYDKDKKVYRYGGKELSSADMNAMYCRLGRQSIPWCPSRTASTRTTGTAGRALTEALGKKVQLVGDDLFVTSTERLGRGHRIGSGQRDPGQGQPDRHSHRNPGRGAHGPARELPRGHLAPLGRDLRHVHRRPGRGHQRRPDQDRLGVALRSHRQVQPALAHRRRSRRRPAATPARPRSPARRAGPGAGRSAPRRGRPGARRGRCPGRRRRPG